MAAEHREDQGDDGAPRPGVGLYLGHLPGQVKLALFLQIHRHDPPHRRRMIPRYPGAAAAPAQDRMIPEAGGLRDRLTMGQTDGLAAHNGLPTGSVGAPPRMC